MELKHTVGLSLHGSTLVVQSTDDTEFRCMGIAYGWNEEPIYEAGKLINKLTPTDEALANAKLWAGASDLMKALATLLAQVDGACGTALPITAFKGARDEARAALAKATEPA